MGGRSHAIGVRSHFGSRPPYRWGLALGPALPGGGLWAHDVAIWLSVCTEHVCALRPRGVVRTMGGARFCCPGLDCWAALFASWNGASPGHAATGGHVARAAGGGRPPPLLSSFPPPPLLFSSSPSPSPALPPSLPLPAPLAPSSSSSSSSSRGPDPVLKNVKNASERRYGSCLVEASP